MKKMLLVLAHPDDESFDVGGTVVKYAKAGWSIHLICATNGENGDVGEVNILPGNDLGAVRKREVENAAKVLGISSVTFLGEKDGKLKGCTPGTLEDPMYEKMHEFLPDVVITHDTTGMSNHPDHIKLCYATTFAFQKYAAYLEAVKAAAGESTGRGKDWKLAEYTRAFSDVAADDKEPKLYYVCMPKSIVSYLKKVKVIPEESFDKPWIGTDDKHITTVVDISRFKLTKGKALLCHKTQMMDVDRVISLSNNPLVENEYYILRMQGKYEVYMGKSDRVSNAL